MAKTTLHELLVILRDLLTQLAEAEKPKSSPPAAVSADDDADDEAPKPTLTPSEPLPQGHAFHWILDRYGGSPQPCCKWHAEHMFRPVSPRMGDLQDALTSQQRRFIHERLGHHRR